LVFSKSQIHFNNNIYSFEMVETSSENVCHIVVLNTVKNEQNLDLSPSLPTQKLKASDIFQPN